MRRSLAALAATFYIPLAAAQGASHAHHGAIKESTRVAEAATARAGAPAGPGETYRSAFTDYRLFSADVAPKGWRAANDEVRDVGGHIGLMKAQSAQQTGHGTHGAKQPTLPAPPDRK